MPGETSIALQALLVSLTPTTHISADGHQDNSASSVSASIAAGLTRHISQRRAIETKHLPVH